MLDKQRALAWYPDDVVEVEIGLPAKHPRRRPRRIFCIYNQHRVFFNQLHRDFDPLQLLSRFSEVLWLVLLLGLLRNSQLDFIFVPTLHFDRTIGIYNLNRALGAEFKTLFCS